MTQPANLNIQREVLEVDIERSGDFCRHEARLLYAEDVDELPLELHILVSSACYLHLSLTLTELAKSIDILNIAMHSLKDILMAIKLMQYLLKTLIVFTQHHDVNIIIPRDKTLVTCCTKQCT